MIKQLFLMCLIMISVMFINRSLFSQYADINTWPEFRGMNSSGVAHPEQDPPVTFDSDVNLVWKTPLISGMSSPCIWGDRIFLTGFDSENQQLQILCYNRLNGELIWNRIVPAKEIEPYHATGSPADATPATDGEHVYFHFGSYGLLCYDFAGEVLWTYELPINDNIYGSGASPILVDNLVILPVRRPKEGHYMLALNSKSGQQVWKRPIKYIGWSTPILCGNDLIYHGINIIAGYNVNDGSEKWRVSIRTTGTSTPVINNDILYVATYTILGEQNRRLKMPNYQELITKYDTNGDSLISKKEFPKDFQYNRYPEIHDTPDAILYLIDFWGMVDPDKNLSIDSLEWQAFLDLYSLRSIDHGLVAIKSGGTGDITASHILWRENEEIPEVPSPLFYKGYIYMIKNGGKVTCINALTGERLYQERLEASGPYFSSPIAAKDRIYIASFNGNVVVFETGGELKVLAINNLGEKISATPAIVNDKLYIRTSKHLYAFGE
jgi:outer membrane protein assembly factor BamB